MSKWVALGLLLGKRLIEIQLNGKCLKARQSINASLEVAHARPVTTIRDRVTDAYHHPTNSSPPSLLLSLD